VIDDTSNRIEMPRDSRLVDVFRMLTHVADVNSADFFDGVWEVEVFCEGFIEDQAIPDYVEEKVLGGNAPLLPQRLIGDPCRRFTTDGHTLMRYSLYLGYESDFVAKFVRTADQATPFCEVHFTEHEDLYVVCHDDELYWIFEEVRDFLKMYRY